MPLGIGVFHFSANSTSFDRMNMWSIVPWRCCFAPTGIDVIDSAVVVLFSDRRTSPSCLHHRLSKKISARPLYTWLVLSTSWSVYGPSTSWCASTCTLWSQTSSFTQSKENRWCSLFALFPWSIANVSCRRIFHSIIVVAMLVRGINLLMYPSIAFGPLSGFPVQAWILWNHGAEVVSPLSPLWTVFSLETTERTFSLETISSFRE